MYNEEEKILAELEQYLSEKHSLVMTYKKVEYTYRRLRFLKNSKGY